MHSTKTHGPRSRQIAIATIAALLAITQTVRVWSDAWSHFSRKSLCLVNVGYVNALGSKVCSAEDDMLCHVLLCTWCYLMLWSWVVTGLNLKYFAYFTTNRHVLIFCLRTAAVVGHSSHTKPASAWNLKESVLPLPFILQQILKVPICRF
jgi:hypothetical protein